MGLVQLKCSQCGAEIDLDDSFSGQEVHCLKCGHVQPLTGPEFKKGFRLGGYILDKKLGVGGMGEVWLAEQVAMSRRVALKILSPGLSSDSNFLSRFLKEVKISAKMDHPNIVTAFDAGEDDGIYFMAISFVDGRTLADMLEKQRILPESVALKFALNIAHALNYAWEEFHILHRDIKPENIMIDKKGTPKLMDMGISKSCSEDLSLTMTGTVVGSPYYMSPEQALGKRDLDCRADIYALGATLYHLVTGFVAFEGDSLIQVLSMQVNNPLISPKLRNDELSTPCVKLIEKMMQKKRENRQQDWEEVIRDVQMVFDGREPVSRKDQAEIEMSDTVVEKQSPFFPFEEQTGQFSDKDWQDTKLGRQKPVVNTVSGKVLLIFGLILIVIGVGVYFFKKTILFKPEAHPGNQGMVIEKPVKPDGGTGEKQAEQNTKTEKKDRDEGVPAILTDMKEVDLKTSDAIKVEGRRSAGAGTDTGKKGAKEVPSGLKLDATWDDE